MPNTLIDAGPLIALFDKRDKFHQPVLDFLAAYSGRLITTWPVITEVVYMLDFNQHAQGDFLTWLQRDALHIANLDKEHLTRLCELWQTYQDVPMDLADGSLLVIAELTGITDILTVDSDYFIYRIKGKRSLNNLLAPYIAEYL